MLVLITKFSIHVYAHVCHIQVHIHAYTNAVTLYVLQPFHHRVTPGTSDTCSHSHPVVLGFGHGGAGMRPAPAITHTQWVLGLRNHSNIC